MKMRVNAAPWLFCVALSSVLLSAAPANAGLKIYYIRHAEGGHNVKQDWEYRKVPKDQWPDYVGNHNMFTPKGLKQQAAVSKLLQQFDIDFVAASPAWRCQNTILDYMKETGRVGEVWPELHELRAGSGILADDLPVISDPILGAGAAIELPAEEATVFKIREDGKNWFATPRYKEASQFDAAAKQIIQHALDMIQSRFGGTDQSILLSGHGSSGQAVLRLLTKNPLSGFTSIANTGVWMAEEQANGEFKVMMYNSFPLEHGKPSAASKHKLMDLNCDGNVTKDEYVMRYASGFRRKDRDQNGTLSEAEYAHSSFKHSDKNSDGQVTLEEFEAVYEEQFDNSYDKNKDGIASIDEIR